MKNEDIDFLMFTVKQSENRIADVAVDLFVREYTIVYTDLYGQTIEPEKGGKLRRKKVAEFSKKLEELDIITMPRKENNTLPIHLKNATLMYVIKDVQYYTDGYSNQGLAKLHKEIEGLIGTTFGSYSFYE